MSVSFVYVCVVQLFVSSIVQERARHYICGPSATCHEANESDDVGLTLNL